MTTTLRPMRPEDLAALTNDQAPHADFGPQHREAVAPSSLDDDGALTVVLGDEVFGEVAWHYVQWGPTAASRCPMIGIWLVPGARGRGHGTEAQRMLVDLLFRHTATNRIEAHTDVENQAEQKALVGCGFQREGVIREAQWREGRFRDGFLYSLLRAEWRS